HYYVQRKTTDDVRQPHSIEMQALAELGILGALGLGAFVVAVGLGTIRHLRARARAPADLAVLTAAIGIFSAWLAHSSVDWSHLVPGATGVALLAAAYLVTAPTADHRPAEAVRRGAATIAVRALVSLAIVA